MKFVVDNVDMTAAVGNLSWQNNNLKRSVFYIIDI